MVVASEQGGGTGQERDEKRGLGEKGKNASPAFCDRPQFNAWLDSCPTLLPLLSETLQEKLFGREVI